MKNFLRIGFQIQTALLFLFLISDSDQTTCGRNDPCAKGYIGTDYRPVTVTLCSCPSSGSCDTDDWPWPVDKSFKIQHVNGHEYSYIFCNPIPRPRLCKGIEVAKELTYDGSGDCVSGTLSRNYCECLLVGIRMIQHQMWQDNSLHKIHRSFKCSDFSKPPCKAREKCVEKAVIGSTERLTYKCGCESRKSHCEDDDRHTQFGNCR